MEPIITIDNVRTEAEITSTSFDYYDYSAFAQFLSSTMVPSVCEMQ